MTDADLVKLLDTACHQIGEHFDSVQILATRVVEGRTHSLKRGVGNWYARRGMCQELIESDIAQENATQIKEALNPPEQP